MGYRFTSGLGKDRLPVLIARDGALSADSLRAAIALFNHLAAGSGGAATVADIIGATGLAAERGQAALKALAAAGYIEAEPAAADASPRAAPLGPSAAASRPAPAAPPPQGGRRLGKGGRLRAGIMDYEWDLDGLIRAGNANIRDAGRRASRHRPEPDGGAATTRDGAGEASWDPLLGEDSQPAAIRFMVWLRFVLGPDEMAACDRFALAHKDQWNGWIESFFPAKAAGTEDQLLDHIRRRLAAAADDQAGPPPPPDPGPRLPRPN